MISLGGLTPPLPLRCEPPISATKWIQAPGYDDPGRQRKRRVQRSGAGRQRGGKGRRQGRPPAPWVVWVQPVHVRKTVVLEDTKILDTKTQNRVDS